MLTYSCHYALELIEISYLHLLFVPAILKGHLILENYKNIKSVLQLFSFKIALWVLLIMDIATVIISAEYSIWDVTE